VSIDGKLFAKIDEGSYNYVGNDNFEMRQLSFTVRDGINRRSTVIDSIQDPNKKILLVHNLSPNIFGNVTPGGTSNIIQITKSEP